MYSKLFALAALCTLVAAAPPSQDGAARPSKDDTAHPPQAITADSCNVGQQHCCNSVQSANSQAATKALGGLANFITGSVTGQLGIGCNPIGAAGASANSCNAQPVCCTGNNFKGAVVIGCSPMSIL